MNEKQVEDRELIEELKNEGFGHLIRCLGDGDLYLGNGRLNMTALANRMGLSYGAAMKVLADARGVANWLML